jgi:hypothetical protein
VPDDGLRPRWQTLAPPLTARVSPSDTLGKTVSPERKPIWGRVPKFVFSVGDLVIRRSFYRGLNALPERAELERDLVFVGLIGLADPPRARGQGVIARDHDWTYPRRLATLKRPLTDARKLHGRLAQSGLGRRYNQSRFGWVTNRSRLLSFLGFQPGVVTQRSS